MLGDTSDVRKMYATYCRVILGDPTGSRWRNLELRLKARSMLTARAQALEETTLIGESSWYYDELSTGLVLKVRDACGATYAAASALMPVVASLEPDVDSTRWRWRYSAPGASSRATDALVALGCIQLPEAVLSAGTAYVDPLSGDRLTLFDVLFAYSAGGEVSTLTDEVIWNEIGPSRAL